MYIRDAQQEFVGRSAFVEGPCWVELTTTTTTRLSFAFQSGVHII